MIRVMPDAPIRLSRETMGEVPHGIPRPDNANYLWIQLFHSTLNETGRAGFVMANSAGDARSSEQVIRQRLIDSGAVDEKLNEKGYIVPGLGDAGDRLFGTK